MSSPQKTKLIVLPIFISTKTRIYIWHTSFLNKKKTNNWFIREKEKPIKLYKKINKKGTTFNRRLNNAKTDDKKAYAVFDEMPERKPRELVCIIASNYMRNNNYCIQILGPNCWRWATVALIILPNYSC